jgi:hypothetical protein
MKKNNDAVAAGHELIANIEKLKQANPSLSGSYNHFLSNFASFQEVAKRFNGESVAEVTNGTVPRV